MATDGVIAVRAVGSRSLSEVHLARDAVEAVGATCRWVDLDQLIELTQAGEAASTSVVLFLPSVVNAAAAARAVHRAWPRAYVVFVRDSSQVADFRASLGFAPMLGRLWTVAADTRLELAAACRQALQTTRRQLALRTTLDVANARLTATRSVTLAEYDRLLAAENHLSNFLRVAEIAAFGVDGRKDVAFWSPGAAKLLGIAAEHAVGRQLSTLGDWARVVEEVLARAGADHARLTAEELVELGGSQRALEVLVLQTPSFGHSVVLRDVTERRRTQDQLRRANLELQQAVSHRTEELEKSQLALLQAQKLEAVGKLTGGVAHDFNNVLQVIGSNLQLLQPLVEPVPGARPLVRSALGAVDRGAKLASHLLAFARRQPLDPVPLNVNRLLGEMDDLLRRALGERIQVETVLSGGLWTTLADANQLENVILNLAINGRDAMPDGGRLTVETANAELDDRYVSELPDVARGQYVMVAVSDTGHGMPPDVVARAFEPFFSTKPEGEGTGLGLSMAYGFAKQSGGHIKIYSEVGQGTTIRLYLPRSFEREVVQPVSRAGPVEGGNETILVVEDDLAVQAAVVQMLEALGYRVLRANDGQAGLAVLESGAEVDLVFTDVVMPGGVSSPELARHARRLRPGIEVLFTSGYTSNAVVHGGRLDPGVELLSKPYRQEDLARKVRSLLRRRQPAGGVARTKGGDARGNAAAPLHVLLVEDDADLREVTVQMLGLLACKATAVASAEEAEAALHVGGVDLVITDHQLPGRSGSELARIVRRRYPAVPVVIASGYGNASQDGEVWNLPKPFGLPELEEVLHRARQVQRE